MPNYLGGCTTISQGSDIPSRRSLAYEVLGRQASMLHSPRHWPKGTMMGGTRPNQTGDSYSGNGVIGQGMLRRDSDDSQRLLKVLLASLGLNPGA